MGRSRRTQGSSLLVMRRSLVEMEMVDGIYEKGEYADGERGRN